MLSNDTPQIALLGYILNSLVSARDEVFDGLAATKMVVKTPQQKQQLALIQAYAYDLLGGNHRWAQSFRHTETQLTRLQIERFAAHRAIPENEQPHFKPQELGMWMDDLHMHFRKKGLFWGNLLDSSALEPGLQAALADLNTALERYGRLTSAMLRAIPEDQHDALLAASKDDGEMNLSNHIPAFYRKATGNIAIDYSYFSMDAEGKKSQKVTRLDIIIAAEIEHVKHDITTAFNHIRNLTMLDVPAIPIRLPLGEQMLERLPNAMMRIDANADRITLLEAMVGLRLSAISQVDAARINPELTPELLYRTGNTENLTRVTIPEIRQAIITAAQQHYGMEVEEVASHLETAFDNYLGKHRIAKLLETFDEDHLTSSATQRMLMQVQTLDYYHQFAAMADRDEESIDLMAAILELNPQYIPAPNLTTAGDLAMHLTMLITNGIIFNALDDSEQEQTLDLIVDLFRFHKRQQEQHGAAYRWEWDNVMLSDEIDTATLARFVQRCDDIIDKHPEDDASLKSLIKATKRFVTPSRAQSALPDDHLINKGDDTNPDTQQYIY